MKLGKQITRGAFYIGAGKTASLFIYMLNVTLIPRFLGPESMGFYSYWLSVYFILTIFMNFGAVNILMRYVPELREREQGSIRPLIKNVIQIKFPVILIIILIGLFLFKEERIYFCTILLASFLYSIIAIEKTILYSFKDMRKYSIVDLARIFIRLLFILLFFYLLRDTGILLAILLSTLSVTLIFGFTTFKLIPPTSGELAKPFRNYLTFGLFTYLAGIFVTLTTWLAIIISRKYTGNMAMVGYLGLGIQICFSVIAYLMQTIGESIFPSLVEFHVTDDERFNKSIELNWKYTNLILIPLITGFFILANPIVTIVIGEKYIQSVGVIKLLLPATVLLVWSRVYSQILFIYERKVTIFLTGLCGFIVFLGSLFFFIKNWSILGAALSVSLGASVSFVYIFIYSLRVLKIPSQLSNLLKPLLASTIMCLAIVFIKASNPISLSGIILLGLSVYFAVMIIIRGITKVDVQRIRYVFR